MRIGADEKTTEYGMYRSGDGSVPMIGVDGCRWL